MQPAVCCDPPCSKRATNGLEVNDVAKRDIIPTAPVIRR